MCVVLLQQLRDVRFGGDVAVRDARDSLARSEGEDVIARLRRRRASKRRKCCGDAARDT
jgi:hypothetical protein